MNASEFAFVRFALLVSLLSCIPQGLVQAAQFGPGWTLAGNSRNAVIDVPVVFGTKSAPVSGVTDAVNTIWKWDAIGQKWAFFTPTMDLDQLATYADSKGYTVLKSIFPGEGYWVNASKSTSIADSTAPAFTLGPWALSSGFNLVATGSAPTPAQFSSSIAPFSATTLWAWDSTQNNWYFHTPTLDSTQLAAYIAQKNYLAFAGRTLDSSTGFWVNRAAVTGSPTANLPALDQAKQMFSELRTTFHAFSNSAGTGSLDDQIRRMKKDLTGLALPSVRDVLRRVETLNVAGRLFRAVKSGKAGAYAYVPVSGTTTGRYFAYSNEYPSFSGLSTRIPGSGYISCATDPMTSATDTAVTRVSCTVYGATYPTFVNGSLTEQFFTLAITETSADKYAYTAQGRKTTGTTTTTVGAQMSGTWNTAYDANGKILTADLAGDFPALTQGLDILRGTLHMERALLTASPSTYRYTATGTVTGLDAAGATVSSFTMDTGSHYDTLEDAFANPAPNNTKEINVTGIFQTKGTRANGALVAKAFLADADGQSYIPTDVSFTGSLTDISPGGSGAILNVTLTEAISNYPAFHSGQAATASNYEHISVALNGTIKLPSRPLMTLVLNDSATGPGTFALSGQYSYDNGLTISITGTLDDNSSANSSLTFTNQDGVVFTRPAVGDGAVTKSGTTLGQIKKSVIYYTDGVFESLN